MTDEVGRDASMGTFAETAIIVYRLSFVDQGKQTSVFRFNLQQTNGSFNFPFSIFAVNKHKLSFSVNSVFRLSVRMGVCVCVFGGVGVFVCVCIFIFIFVFMILFYF